MVSNINQEIHAITFFFYLIFIDGINHCQDLKINLHVQRRNVSEITIKIPVQFDTFQQFLAQVKPITKEKKGTHTLYRTSCGRRLSTYFDDENWWYRIVNEHGDHANVVEKTIQSWLHEHQCLSEFVKVGKELK